MTTTGSELKSIVIAEEAAFAEWELHDVDVARRDAGCQGERRVGGRGSGRGGIAERIFAFAHRDDVGESCGLNARERAHAFEHVEPGGANLVGICERCGR